MATHTFEPTQYYRTLGWHEPVLRIADGDTVQTRTIDAWGQDHTGAQVSPRGNPMTGPFYVEGAQPGDTLVVQIDAITPNRAIGYTFSVLAPNVVDPEFVHQLPETQPLEWRIDNAAGTATLITAVHPSINGKVFPLAPMLGCFGTAPAGEQAISTATSSSSGGNMDYRGYGIGTTCYFPVYAPGGLFHLGDAHAVQGDGEIIGTGIEISCDVQFTVQVQKGRTINHPRGENDTHIFTAGNARPLDQALQHATTEMTYWLMNDYGFDPVGASVLLGMAVEYEVGNVYDPAYTMVCKLAKSWLVRA